MTTGTLIVFFIYGLYVVAGLQFAPKSSLARVAAPFSAQPFQPRGLILPQYARKRNDGGGGAAPQVSPDVTGGPRDDDIGPPPDLPSLLLSNRIIYIGMPLVPSVTELVIAQLLYLNYQSPETITMYINSPGTNSPDGRAFSFDTEAFAIADTMMFIKPPIRTICV
eukprot:gene45010-55062_t